ncbi:hypothetical protein EIP91_009994 [Steccherinum ochraceum]|uniref:Uncharacterized protein n=1 Tax=Steccherinum ochraceum TaxID=92696 RepID=A0A4R0RJA2_9APHY|nr:hypothetical protein EIP91_009994 [Steccherinum ochraceum]
MSIQPIPETYKQAYEERLEKYTYTAAASALFFFSDAGQEEQGVRIEAPEIMKEFVDKVTFGRDPVGTLFYNNIDDIQGATKYNVTYSQTSVPNDDACVVVQFFGHTQGKFYAEFVGRDPARTVWWTVDGTQHRGGSWNSLALTTATAYVYKRSTESNVSITITPIRKQVSFDLPGGTDTGKNLSVWGNLSTNDISKLDKGGRSFIPQETKASDVTALGDMRFTSVDPIAIWDDYVPE